MDIPEYLLKHLKMRESVVYKVYLDHLGNPTGGCGHLLSPGEIMRMPVGTALSREQVDTWLEQDTAWAWRAACEQAHMIGEPELRDALFHVNFQLGDQWFREHKKTWQLLQENEWEKAALEAADSKWYDQTPKRVLDLQVALWQQAEIARTNTATV